MQRHAFIAGIFILLIALSGCIHIASRDNVDKTNLVKGNIQMAEKNIIESGDTVTLYYIGKLEDGSIFDQTSEGNPATFPVGTGQLIKGFNDGLIGMKKGENKIITVPAADAYGEINLQAIIEVPRKQLEDANIPILLGVPVNAQGQSGKIVDINADTNTVRIDFNHPLAGKKLIFDVNIVGIKGTAKSN